MAARDWVDAAEAARRLGVKPATLYSYVSRGLLRSRRDADGRRSLFDAAEVAALRRRAHPPSQDQQLTIESAITTLGDDRPYYRGRDALALARTATFEQVAEWLWSGPEAPTATPWQADPAAAATAAAAQALLPETALPLDRLHVVVTTLAMSDPLRFALEPESVAAVGRSMIAGMVEALPAQRRRRPGPAIAERLWSRLARTPPASGLLRALDAALILLADHELAASTVAARVAASVQADPYAVVSAGLGVVGGPMHGGATLGAERMLAEVRDPESAAAVIGERLRRGERIPGIGHMVYREADGRARVLLDLVRAAAPGHPRLQAAEALLAEFAARGLPMMNIDFSLAALTAVAGMVTGAGEAVFAVARTAGWLAHALEEYAHPSPLRPRAVYVGPAPLDAPLEPV